MNRHERRCTASKAKHNKFHQKESVKMKPRSLAVAERGITTGQQYCSLMSAIMMDVISGDLTPGQANAMVNTASLVKRRAKALDARAV
jgi:hypothetical protein